MDEKNSNENSPEITMAAERISNMEFCMDVLQKALDETPNLFREDASLTVLLQTLTQYYENGQWLSDYELDEQGLLSPNLKRGVLSQGAIYDLLERIDGIV